MSNTLQGKVALVTAAGHGTACVRFRWHFLTGNRRRGLSRMSALPPKADIGSGRS
jgi:hypothetical protein